MMERFSSSYSENRIILMTNQCQACLTSARVLGMPGPAGQSVPVLGSALSFASSLGPSLQHSPGQLWDSVAISHNIYITHHYFSSLPCSGPWCSAQDMDPLWISRFCLCLAVWAWVESSLGWFFLFFFFCFATRSSLFRPNLETCASGYIDFRWTESCLSVCL